MDKVVLDEFLTDPARVSEVVTAIRLTILNGTVTEPPTANETAGEDFGVDEGKLLWVKHLRRERSPKLRREKLVDVRAKGLPIACEVCAFDFAATYGALGDGYIEVHHVLPLHASGPTETRLDDLALLCSNCLRMIHTARPWPTPATLKTVITTLPVLAPTTPAT